MAAFWSAVQIAVSKWILTEIDPLSLLALDMSIAAIALVIWLWASQPRRRLATLRGPGWKWTAALSVLFFFTLLGSFMAIELLDPTVVSFVSRVETLVAVILGVTFFRERFTRIEVIGGALVVVGIAAIRYSGGISIERGFWFILVASIGFGIAEVLAKKAVTIVDTLAFTGLRNALLAIAFLAVAGARPGGIATPDRPLMWLGIAVVAFSGPVLARVHFLKALQMIHVSKTVLINQSQPIWVALLAFALLRQIPTQREWLGGALVLAGCVILIAGRQKQRVQGQAVLYRSP
jgi:drug/metabolite transporter (DMT)-like permease